MLPELELEPRRVAERVRHCPRPEDRSSAQEKPPGSEAREVETVGLLRRAQAQVRQPRAAQAVTEAADLLTS